jgi:hypothetical protein
MIEGSEFSDLAPRNYAELPAIGSGLAVHPSSAG